MSFTVTSTVTDGEQKVPESFLLLPRDERKLILEDRSGRMNRTAVVLEKDVWVCWTLERLFRVPGRMSMIFKGGTSLSKVYSAIARFSEDIDITLDCRTLVPEFDPFSADATNSAKKRHGERLKAAMAKHIGEVIAPYLAAAIKAEFGDGYAITYDGEEKLIVQYETALEPALGYIKRSILVEFGGRNSIEPSEERVVKPYLADGLEQLQFPAGVVDVLRPERTFWEKATLIHVDCCKSDFRPSKDRSARHWYDLSRLADHEIGRAAVANRALLADVVKFKKVFYPSGNANYDVCLTGGMRLVPEGDMQKHLLSDYDKMIAEGMFEGAPPPFNEVLERLRDLERVVNATQS